METYASPFVGQLAVSKVDKNHILEILQPIWVEKAETASRVRQRLEAILNWSISKGLRDGPSPASWKGNLEFLLPPSTNLKSAKHYLRLYYLAVGAGTCEASITGIDCLEAKAH